MSLRVLEPGLCSLIVDHGRPHTRSLGVPVGGAADRSALALGNAILRNQGDAAALEITLAGPVVVALKQVGCIVLGAPFQLHSSRQALACNRSFTLEPGEELHLGGTPFGARAYLCVVGGFQTPLLLGSRSSLAPVERGDELPCSESGVKSHLLRPVLPWILAPALAPKLRAPRLALRVVAGLQEDWFDVELPAWGDFTVRPASNRMGLRLGGQPVPVPPRELVSEPVCPGAVQVTRDGQMIILGVDGQTIGGYPKIAQVISADLDVLGQLRPGARVNFVHVTQEMAWSLHRDKQENLRCLGMRLRLAAEACDNF